MSTTLFVMPLKAGKTETYKAFLQECLSTRKKEYRDLLRRYNLNTTKIWIGHFNGKDYAIFTHEMGKNAAQLLSIWSTSSHPFDQWFDQQLRDCYEVTDVTQAPVPPEFIGELTITK